MARTSGYVRFECDRCAKREYLLDGSVESRNWYDIRRFRAAQTTSGNPETKTLCAGCYAEYVADAQSDDTDFDQWMTNTDNLEKGRHAE